GRRRSARYQRRWVLGDADGDRLGHHPQVDSSLELLEEMLPGCGHFGGDDYAAIALVGVPAIVVPVVLLRRIERTKWDALGHDGVVPRLLRLGNRFPGVPFLLG